MGGSERLLGKISISIWILDTSLIEILYLLEMQCNVCNIPNFLFLAQGDMLGLLGAALAGAGQVAALHSVREGVGLSPDIYGKS